jgi:8-oxo-dGTP pyrophosphatase MutT (NUDIX family)
MCRYPTNSYGCIVFKKQPSQEIRFLMIQKKYTPEYIELIRGRYYDTEGNLNYQYLLLLIHNLPLIERNYINKYEFNHLWNHVWQWDGTDERVLVNQKECEVKFNRLKQGYQFERYGLISFQLLFTNNPTTIIEPDWELPKGRRRPNENDLSCAIRECCEETSIAESDFKIYGHVKPFQEKFTGVNQIRYCNSYYVGELTNYDKRIYYDPSHKEQNKEIRKIGWFTESEIFQLVNPLCDYRLKMLHDVHTLAMTLTQHPNPVCKI